ncbi:MAG: hypothetical protein KBT36_05810 [Kurthia sp.]|nr:hypothetical protein [Candidatus Kurthia equi]
MVTDKVIVVEGRQDKLQLKPLFAEPVEIICTNGTFSPSRLEEIMQPFEACELYAFFDADETGDKLRKLYTREYPESNHLYTLPFYGGVESTPRHYLAKILKDEGFAVKPGFLLGKG